MAFDKPTRKRLASFVGMARDLIAGEFTQQFQSLYGISDKGTIAPLEQLSHLDDIGLATAALLRERIDYLVKTHPDDPEGIQAAVTRLAREQAFTVLNRLAAIRMAEKRGLIVESVGKGYQSKGFKVFEQVAGSGLGDTYHRFRRYIFCLFDELAVDLGVLFDRRSPQGLLFPRETTLQDLFTLLNAPDLDPLWAEDETIGWIYQYYNDPAERKKMRDESAAPRNSRELAVRNQFFTPRYVVEFLTDNTLGRIWYEMTQGNTRLKNQCRYLVRRPTEIFLKPNETAPETSPQEDLSQEQLFKQPVYVPYRPLKDPRKIGLLDPACGSMHFGLYAFDLFEAIYEEAWELDLESLRHDYSEKEVFLREVPHLIIEHNIHGIDIDPRAVQIAGLSLWLRAQKSWQAQRVPAAQRPRIIRSNIVCAEPMPGSPEMLKEFTDTLHPPLLGQLVEKVFVQMQLAGEAGSLLKIEEEIATLVKDGKKLWQTRPKAEQLELGLGLEVKQKQGELPLDVSGITDERFWETAEERIYAALRAYAEQTESSGYQRRLFAEDAARGFAFIDLCRKRYDVVVMNPPFGAPTVSTVEFLAEKYSRIKTDLYGAFVENALQRLIACGLAGAITSRTCFFLSSFQKWREDIVLTNSHLDVLLDLGGGVLDTAMVETAAYVLKKDAPKHAAYSTFIRLSDYVDKRQALNSMLNQGVIDTTQKNVFIQLLKECAKLPKSPFCYWIPDTVLKIVAQSPPFEPVWGKVFVGVQTDNDERFVRLWVEVPSQALGASLSDTLSERGWITFLKGDTTNPYYLEHEIVLKWFNNGEELRAATELAPGGRVNNEALYYQPGISWAIRTEFFSPHIVPSGCIPSVSRYMAIPNSNTAENRLSLVAILCAPIYDFIAKLQTESWKAPKFIPGIVRGLPLPEIEESFIRSLATLGGHAVINARAIMCQNEPSRLFVIPWRKELPISLLRGQADHNNLLKSHADQLTHLAAAIDGDVNQAFGQPGSELNWQRLLDSDSSDEKHKSPTPIESLVRRNLYSSSDFVHVLLIWLLGCAFGRWDIRFASGERQPPELPDPFAPLPVCPPGMLQNAGGLPAEPKDVPPDYPLCIPWPGILVDDENHPEDIVARVREAIEVIWKERADAIEQEACELLCVKNLRDYFRRPAGFFANHLKNYSKSRRQAPIYWSISTSKGTYTLWIYYHHLTDQTLHMTLADFVDPKLKAVRAEIIALRESGNHRNRLEELLDTEKELADFRTEIERIIKLPWKPNLNDGVLITASPLWKLFRLPKWQKDLKACWEKLEKGEYDWAHLAYSIWPERVEKVCKKDRSIAIAHNLEHLCEAAPPKATGKRKKATASEESEQ